MSLKKVKNLFKSPKQNGNGGAKIDECLPLLGNECNDEQLEDTTGLPDKDSLNRASDGKVENLIDQYESIGDVTKKTAEVMSPDTRTDKKRKKEKSKEVKKAQKSKEKEKVPTNRDTTTTDQADKIVNQFMQSSRQAMKDFDDDLLASLRYRLKLIELECMELIHHYKEMDTFIRNIILSVDHMTATYCCGCTNVKVVVPLVREVMEDWEDFVKEQQPMSEKERFVVEKSAQKRKEYEAHLENSTLLNDQYIEKHQDKINYMDLNLLIESLEHFTVLRVAVRVRVYNRLTLLRTFHEEFTQMALQRKCMPIWLMRYCDLHCIICELDKHYARLNREGTVTVNTVGGKIALN